MTAMEIKDECEKCYSQIKRAEKRLEKLRAGCKHEETFIGDYMWAPGHINFNVLICKYCNTPLYNNTDWAPQESK